MHRCNSLEVSEKTEIRLFSLLCGIGWTLGALTQSTGSTSRAKNPAKGGCVLTSLGLYLVSKEGKKLSCFERAIKAVFKKHTMEQTFQCVDRVAVGQKLVCGLFELINDQGQQKMQHESFIGQRMAIEV